MEQELTIKDVAKVFEGKVEPDKWQIARKKLEQARIEGMSKQMKLEPPQRQD